MKELERKPNNLTNLSQTPYPKGGDIYMEEPGNGETESQRPIGVDEATRRLGEIAARREDARVGDATRRRGQEPLQGSEEQTKLQESLKSIEDAFPEFEGISESVINSLGSEDPRRRLEEVYRNFVSQYQNVESRMIKAYAEKKYEGENVDQQRKADDEEYIRRTGELREMQKKIIGILGEKVGARTRLSPEGQAAVKTIKELKNLIDNKDISEDKKGNLKKELQTKALEIIDELDPENEPIDDETLKAIGADEFASEKFISKIIILPSEDKQYQLHGLYTAVNLNKFLIVNKNWMDASKLQRLEYLVRATETIHEMNRILKTSVEQFAQVSQTILSSHLSTVFGINGVQDVFELYEGVIKENLSIETRITEEVFDAIDEQVVKDFKHRVSKKVISLKGGGGLEDWEEERALIYGRNLVRTLLREQDYISFSDLPKGPGVFVSLAQGQLLNFFHAIKYTLRRFKPGESQGGIELLEAVLDEAKTKRRLGRNKEESKGIVRLSVVLGTDVGDREATKVIATRSALMTWRSTEAILREFDMLDNGRATNVAQFFLDHEKEIAALKEVSSTNAWASEFKRVKGEISGTTYSNIEAWKKARIEQVFGELLNNNATALGVLVSPIPLTMPTEVKQMLWEKIAELNPDVMASILTRLDVDKDAEGAIQLQNVESLEQILLPHFGTDEQRRLLSVNGEWKPTLARRELVKLGEEYSELEGELAKTTVGSDKDRLRGELEEKGKEFDAKKIEFDVLDTQVKKLLSNENWKALRGKLRTINRLRMLDETERIKQVKAFQKGEITTIDSIRSPKGFQTYLDDSRLLEEYGFTVGEDERAVVTAISENGKQITQDLANIQQATIWFLDDVPTDISKWENLGQFFNRTIGDFGQFSQASTEMVQFLANPFKIPIEKALEHQEKAIASAGQVIGIEAAQDNQNGIIMMFNRWIKTYPRYEQVILEMIASSGHKFTSKAQEVTRDTGAPSLNKEAMFATVLTENNKSILRAEKRDEHGKIQFTDNFKAAVRELKLGVWDRVFLQNIKDWGPFFFLGLLIQLFKETTADTKR